jgi:hypothetical protein
MTLLTIMDAVCVTGVSRSQLYRYLRSGKLSRTPDRHLDTAELLRAGLPLHGPPVPSTVPEAHDATDPAMPRVPERVPRVPSADTATLERLIEVLQRELDAARERETLLTQRMHERETQLTQAAHERETQLLHLLAQMQQQNQRLPDLPRMPAPLSPQDAPGRPQPPGRVADAATPTTPPSDPRGIMRRRILEVLRAHPAGLTPAEIQDRLGMQRSLVDTCQGMLRYGLVQRVGRGRYVAAASTQHDSS